MESIRIGLFLVGAKRLTGILDSMRVDPAFPLPLAEFYPCRLLPAIARKLAKDMFPNGVMGATSLTPPR